MAEKNADRVLDLILSQLEKLSENQENLTKEIQKTNIELAKASGIRHAVGEINKWKEGISVNINTDDLKNIKEFYTEHQTTSADIEDLYLITRELRTEIEDYKKFKTKTMTVIAVISFLFATVLTVLGIIAKFH